MAFGKLVYVLATRDVNALDNLQIAQTAIEALRRNYSPDLYAVAVFLTSQPGQYKVFSSSIQRKPSVTDKKIDHRCATSEDWMESTDGTQRYPIVRPLVSQSNRTDPVLVTQMISKVN